MTIAEETAAMRAKNGIRSVTSAQLKALTDSTPTALKTASNVYANPPDGYAEALKVLGVATPTQQSPAPTGPSGFSTAQTEKNSRSTVFTSPPDGYAEALKAAGTPTPAGIDGYKTALDAQRKEGQ